MIVPERYRNSIVVLGKEVHPPRGCKSPKLNLFHGFGSSPRRLARSFPGGSAGRPAIARCLLRQTEARRQPPSQAEGRSGDDSCRGVSRSLCGAIALRPHGASSSRRVRCRQLSGRGRLLPVVPLVPFPSTIGLFSRRGIPAAPLPSPDVASRGRREPGRGGGAREELH